MGVGPRVGTTFAGYRIERVLGRGGMSIVYLAEHPRLKNAVALKLLAPELAEDDVFRERLLRESRLAASISHPNVIPVYDTGEEDGTLFISMRFVDGEDLRELLHGGPLPPERVSAVCAQVAAALDAAHLHGLVHRDVKPANVLVQREPWHVYVADFGLTKHTDARSGATASGLVGTIDYMAPEQIEGRAVDGRADVYSLGCIAFECLTGRPPFQADTEVAVLWAHMRSEPPDVSELDRSLPRALDSVLRRALAKDPGDRHASCAEFAADLEAATGSRRRRRTSSSRLAVRVRRSRVRRRWLRPALIGAATGAALGAAVVGAVYGGAGGDARTVTVVRRPALAAAEQALAGLVPAALRRSCEHAPPPTLDFDASVSCRAGAGTRVQYSHAVSGTRMRAQLLADAVTHGVAMFGAPVSPVGRCGQTPTGIRDWAFVTTGNRAQITRPGAGPALGRLLCYVSSNGWSALEWTDTRVDVLTEAYRTAPTGLYTWWTRHGGPQAQ